MTESPTPPSDQPADAGGRDRVTPDDLERQADDPASDKRSTGEEQAAANRDDEPPA